MSKRKAEVFRIPNGSITGEPYYAINVVVDNFEIEGVTLQLPCAQYEWLEIEGFDVESLLKGVTGEDDDER